MKSLFAILIFLLPLSLFAQRESIQRKIYKADSVVLISHIITREYEVSSDGKNKTAPSFLFRRNVNPKIILSRKLLSNKKRLADILHIEDGIYKHTPATCDEPRNSILIYTKGKLSYIDICFHCQRIHTSEDLKSIVFFDSNKFAKMEALFDSFNLLIRE